MFQTVDFFNLNWIQVKNWMKYFQTNRNLKRLNNIIDIPYETIPHQFLISEYGYDISFIIENSSDIVTKY